MIYDYSKYDMPQRTYTIDGANCTYGIELHTSDPVFYKMVKDCIETHCEELISKRSRTEAQDDK